MDLLIRVHTRDTRVPQYYNAGRLPRFPIQLDVTPVAILPSMKSGVGVQPVRLGFDGLFLEQPMTGAGQYAMQLWRALEQHTGQFEPLLLAPASDSPLPSKARKIWWEQVG